MKARRTRRRSAQCLRRCADRAVATGSILAVTLVLLLAGFTGKSTELRLPGPLGWLYIAGVIFSAALALAWVGRSGGGRGLPTQARNRKTA